MPQTRPSKDRLIAQVKAHVESELAAARRAQTETVRGATHEESRPENDKDTRALEATYLARGLAERVSAIEQTMLALETMRLRDFDEDVPTALGAALRLDDDDSVYFLVPDAGGLKLHLDGVEVITLTPRAPLGRALIGKYQGDEVTFRSPQGARTCYLAEVW